MIELSLPEIPTTQDLEFLQQLAQHDPAQLCGLVVRQLGYGQDVVDGIYQNPDNPPDIKTILHQARRKSVKAYVASERRHIFRMISESDIMPLRFRAFLTLNPDIVEALEKKWCLIRTGCVNQMLEHFRRQFYTRISCFEYLDPLSCLKGAAASGHLENVIRGLREASRIKYNHVLVEAIKGGRVEIAALILEAAGPDRNIEWDRVLSAAAWYGHLDLVKWIVSVSGNKLTIGNLNYGLLSAAGAGELSVIKYLVECGATNLAGALSRLISYHPHISNNDQVSETFYWLTDQLEPSQLNESLITASQCGLLMYVELLVDKGATNLNQALARASNYHQASTEVVNFLLGRGATGS